MSYNPFCHSYLKHVRNRVCYSSGSGYSQGGRKPQAGAPGSRRGSRHAAPGRPLGLWAPRARPKRARRAANRPWARGHVCGACGSNRHSGRACATPAAVPERVTCRKCLARACASRRVLCVLCVHAHSLRPLLVQPQGKQRPPGAPARRSLCSGVGWACSPRDSTRGPAPHPSPRSASRRPRRVPEGEARTHAGARDGTVCRGCPWLWVAPCLLRALSRRAHYGVSTPARAGTGPQDLPSHPAQ